MGRILTMWPKCVLTLDVTVGRRLHIERGWEGEKLPGLARDGRVSWHGVAARRPPSSSLMIRCVASAAGQNDRSGMEFRKNCTSFEDCHWQEGCPWETEEKGKESESQVCVLKIYGHPQTFISTGLCPRFTWVYKWKCPSVSCNFCQGISGVFLVMMDRVNCALLVFCCCNFIAALSKRIRFAHL